MMSYCLDDVRFHGELGNGVSSGFGEDGYASIEDAVKVLLKGLGEDINREGYKQKVKDIVQDALFPEAGLDNKVGHAGGAGGLVIVRDLDHFSCCESCLLPFQVKCHVGYVPSGQRVLGLSKFSRVAGIFARRLQEPQHLADEICSALHQEIQPAGVAVVLQCTHVHFPDIELHILDPNHQGWLETLVSSGSGVFEDKQADDWADFLGLLRLRGTDMEKLKFRRSSDPSWCPSLSIKVSSAIEPANPGMVAAAAKIIKSLGEDPLRKELRETPRRFVEWFRNFQNKPDMKVNWFLCGRKDPLSMNRGVDLNSERVYAELGIPFWAQCEHHLLPFHGVVHIGYFISDGFKPIGRSHLQSIIHFYGFKLQVQERLTRQIAEAISPLLGGDVIVVAEASHTCMISRGIEKFGSNTSTIAVLGRFATEVTARASFLKTIPSPASPAGQ
ncbi:hypothetical protein PIB30_031296 [Stylosanthes scabra]|uniref:GTP cyclohydrolase 1 n=1 Tax=Stylosanthes scabra TaxID=79078 RepID=A0ABU6QBD3_9FABA|nr:hypothetical protein [Stylosanthes scabra]